MLGNLFSPDAWRNTLLPYALDNGRFLKPGQVWSEEAYWRLLYRAQNYVRRPLWALCPDVVGDWKATLADWDLWTPTLDRFGFTPAIAVQDGATVADVRATGAEIVFVGGTTAWKWRTVEKWTNSFQRVHVGRVNSLRKAFDCSTMGVESIDGTGWMRTTRQRRLLRKLLRMMAGTMETQAMLFPGRCSPSTST